jgi:hypothetical protein
LLSCEATTVFASLGAPVDWAQKSYALGRDKAYGLLPAPTSPHNYHLTAGYVTLWAGAMFVNLYITPVTKHRQAANLRRCSTNSPRRCSPKGPFTASANSTVGGEEGLSSAHGCSSPSRPGLMEKGIPRSAMNTDAFEVCREILRLTDPNQEFLLEDNFDVYAHGYPEPALLPEGQFEGTTSTLFVTVLVPFIVGVFKDGAKDALKEPGKGRPQPPIQTQRSGAERATDKVPR